MSKKSTAKIIRPIVRDGASDIPILFMVNANKEQLFALYCGLRVNIKRWTLIVPSGSVTNFLSVPKFFRPLVRFFVSPVDRHLAVPAIIHDYLVSEWTTDHWVYLQSEDIYVKTETADITWKDAADIFKDYCDHHFPGSKTAWLKSRMAWLLICAFGIYAGKLNKKL